MDKAKERFFQDAEGVRMMFIPQCCKCERNVNFSTCKIYENGKPADILANDVQCQSKLEIK